MTVIPGRLTPRVVAAVIEDLLNRPPFSALQPGSSATDAFRQLYSSVEELRTKLAHQVHFLAQNPGNTTPAQLRTLDLGRADLQAAEERLVAWRRFVRDDDQYADHVARLLGPVRDHLQKTADSLLRRWTEAVQEAAHTPVTGTPEAPSVDQEAGRVASAMARRLTLVIDALPRLSANHVGQLSLAQAIARPLQITAVLAAQTRFHTDPGRPEQVEAYEAFSTALAHLGHAVAALGEAAACQATLARPDTHPVLLARLDDGLDAAYVALHRAVTVLHRTANLATGGPSRTLAHARPRPASLASGPVQRGRR